jgi:hypothetical protein
MGGESMPSIAAVVGSVDATAAKYAARVSMQTGRSQQHLLLPLLCQPHRGIGPASGRGPSQPR